MSGVEWSFGPVFWWPSQHGGCTLHSTEDYILSEVSRLLIEHEDRQTAMERLNVAERNLERISGVIDSSRYDYILIWGNTRAVRTICVKTEDASTSSSSGARRNDGDGVESDTSDSQINDRRPDTTENFLTESSNSAVHPSTLNARLRVREIFVLQRHGYFINS